jgi:PTH1 family peptidyl-tRNA hydrolase
VFGLRRAARPAGGGGAPALLLVGLGNPGREYAGQRHNVGFMALDAIADRHGLSPPRNRFRGSVREGAVDGIRVLALKPMTFMNESGRAVGEAARFYKLGPDAVVAFHDELDLAPGKVRVKVGGGAAGHNGLRSLDAHLGANYRRVRIGIGHPGHKDRVLGHVLHDFSRDDAAWLEPVLEAIAEAAPDLVRGEDANFMNRVALRVQEHAAQAGTR